MNRSLVLSALLFAMFTGPPAFAQDRAQVEGAPHKGPRAYHAMCRREPALCAGDLAAGKRRGTAPPARLTAASRRVLARVNTRINARVRSVHDLDLYGVSDFWTAGEQAGDCEDYMIAKKQALIAAGWSPDQLLYAVVEGTETPFHAVLIVRTDRGDLVLDNLRSRILDWRATGYRFVVRQSAADPRRWVRVVTAQSRLAVRGE